MIIFIDVLIYKTKCLSSLKRNQFNFDKLISLQQRKLLKYRQIFAPSIILRNTRKKLLTFLI